MFCGHVLCRVMRDSGAQLICDSGRVRHSESTTLGCRDSGRPGLALVVLSVVEQRLDAVRAAPDGGVVAEVAASVGVHRSTLHRWTTRYLVEGLAGLSDRSHRPSSCPHQVVQRDRYLRRLDRGGGLVPVGCSRPPVSARSTTSWGVRTLTNPDPAGNVGHRAGRSCSVGAESSGWRPGDEGKDSPKSEYPESGAPSILGPGSQP
jgi:hypothetical protein